VPVTNFNQKCYNPVGRRILANKNMQDLIEVKIRPREKNADPYFLLYPMIIYSTAFRSYLSNDHISMGAKQLPGLQQLYPMA
jgi:hypothetical protein